MSMIVTCPYILTLDFTPPYNDDCFLPSYSDDCLLTSSADNCF